MPCVVYGWLNILNHTYIYICIYGFPLPRVIFAGYQVENISTAHFHFKAFLWRTWIDFRNIYLTRVHWCYPDTKWYTIEKWNYTFSLQDNWGHRRSTLVFQYEAGQNPGSTCLLSLLDSAWRNHIFQSDIVLTFAERTIPQNRRCILRTMVQNLACCLKQHYLFTFCWFYS